MTRKLIAPVMMILLGFSAVASAKIMLKEGEKAPNFALMGNDGKTHKLSDFRGEYVVLYFYPKDETPGCTKEACSFRDTWDAIAKTGAVLVGISADSLESHRQFTAHHKLPFLLVSDPDGAIAKLFGVPFDVVHKRQTIVVGPDGVVRKVYRHVDVSVHAKQILDDLTGAADGHVQG